MKRYFTSSRLLRHRRRWRVTAIALVGLLVLVGWGVEGRHIIAKLNPTLRRELALAQHPPLDVWVTPPDYAGAAPLIISTPAAVLFQQNILTIAKGSTVSAHLAEQDGDAPELIIDGDSKEFTTDAHGDFAATETLTSGKKLSIRRGWLTLASWKINVVTDAAPKVAITAPPVSTESKTVRLSYSASDDFGITEMAARITPHNPLPGANNNPIDIPLAVTPAKEITHVDFEDLTARPWAGQKVTIQIVATNQAGQTSVSDGVDFTVPERSFFHPVARVLIDERKKLLQHPDDETLRREAATVMAAIARDTGDYHGDPVVLLSLRSGAVRLILDRDTAAAMSVNDLLWQAATRIEDGSAGSAQRKLGDARQDLAKAIGRNAGAEEIQKLTENLQQAIGVYLSRILSHGIISGKVQVRNQVPAADVGTR